MSDHAWRAGRSVGRTVYEQLSDDPMDFDALIGLMDTPAYADQVVATRDLALWLTSLNERERRTVILTQIIARAHEALGHDKDTHL